MKKLMIAAASAVAIGFSAVAADWFNGGIADGWPTAGTGLSGGAWSNVGEMQYVAGTGVEVTAPTNAPLTFTANATQDVSKITSATISSAITFTPFPIDELPAIQPGTKAGVILVKDGNDRKYYGVQFDEDGGTNSWIDLEIEAGTTDVAVPVEVVIRADGSGDYSIGGDTNSFYWDNSAEGATISAACYAGDGAVANLVATYEAAAPAVITVDVPTGEGWTAAADPTEGALGDEVTITYTANEGKLFANGDPTITITGGLKADGTLDTTYPTEEELETKDPKVKIGTTYYLTLKAAFDAAQDDDTIVVLADTTVDARINIDPTKDITLDANEKTITIATGIYAFVYGGATETTGEGTFTVKGNGTFYAPTANSTCFLWARRGNIVVENGSFSMDGTGQCVYADNGCTATINGGTFVNRTGNDVLNVHNTRSAVADIQCYGGTFSTDPANGDDALGGSFVAANYYSVKPAGATLYTVQDATGLVACIGSKGYTTLGQAVIAVEDGDTVKLLASASANGISFGDYTATLDLNGQTLTVSSEFDNGGTLTIVNGVAGQGGLAIDGTVCVDGVLDISALTYGAGGLLANHDGTLFVSTTGKAKLLNEWAALTPNWLAANRKGFLEAEEDAQVQMGAKVYTADDDGLFLTANTVAKATTTASGVTYVETFDSLATAIAAANAGTTVTLLADIETAEPAAYVINKDITLDFATYMIEKTVANDWVFDIANGATVVFDGEEGGVKQVQTAKNPDWPASMIRNKGNLTIKGGVYTSDFCIIKNDEDPGAGTLTVDGGEFNIVPAAEGMDDVQMALMNWATATINGGTWTGTICTRSCDVNNVSKFGTTEITADLEGEVDYMLMVGYPGDTTYANVPKMKGVDLASVQLTKVPTITDELELVEDGDWVTVAQAAAPWSGSGTEEDPYQIAEEKDLQELQKWVADGKTTAGKFFKLTTSIALTEKWAGIGTYSSSSNPNSFEGVFDGGDYEITDVVFADNNTGSAASEENNYRGFFNQIYNATVKNLTVVGTGFDTDTITTTEYGCALICGHAYASVIKNCISQGTIASATHNAAGIVIRLRDSQVIECTNEADITGSYTKVAGICALVQNSSTAGKCSISYCSNAGTITADGDSSKAGRDGVGGIIAWIGETGLTIEDCSNTGAIFLGNTVAPSAAVRAAQIAGWAQYQTKAIDGEITGRADTLMIGDLTNNKSFSTVTRHFAMSDDETATLIEDSDVSDGGVYKVMAPNGAYVLTTEDSMIVLDESLVTATVTQTVGDNYEVKHVGNVYSVAAKMVTINVTPDANATYVATNGSKGVAFSGNTASVITNATVVFTATPADGYKYAEAPEGWTLAGGVITKEVTLIANPTAVEIPAPTKAGPEPINPDVPTWVIADDEDAATNAVQVARPAGVTDAVVSAEAYDQYFVKTATKVSEGLYTVTATLKEEIVKATDETAEVAAELTTFTDSFSIENAKPGLYYAIRQQNTLAGGASTTDPVMADANGDVTIKGVTRWSDSGFYQVIVTDGSKLSE